MLPAELRSCRLKNLQYGQSGVGKSSFLNHLLGAQLFVEGEVSQVGTSFVTELQYHDGSHFDVEILWMTASEWCASRCPASDASKAETLLSAARAKVTDRRSFPDVTTMFKQLSLELQTKSTVTKEAWEAGDFSEAPAWCFVRRVIIRSRQELLKLVNVVDLPGFHDADPIRDNLAMDFIKTVKLENDLQSIKLFILLDKNRAQNDWTKMINDHDFPLTADQLKALIMRRQLSAISLVITKCDVGVPSGHESLAEIGAGVLYRGEDSNEEQPVLDIARFTILRSYLAAALGRQFSTFVLSALSAGLTDVSPELRTQLQVLAQQSESVSVFPGAYGKNRFKNVCPSCKCVCMCICVSACVPLFLLNWTAELYPTTRRRGHWLPWCPEIRAAYGLCQRTGRDS